MASKKEVFSFLMQVCLCAEKAADKTGKSTDLARLIDCIRRQEKEHRAFGRRLVGGIGARMSLNQACDYFVARVLASGPKYKRVSDLDRTREDYVRGAILMSNKEFRAAFRTALCDTFRESEKVTFARILETDYTALIGG